MKLVRVGDLTEGALFETPHTRRFGVVLEQTDMSTVVELDDLLFGGFEQKSLAPSIQVHPREAQL